MRRRFAGSCKPWAESQPRISKVERAAAGAVRFTKATEPSDARSVVPWVASGGQNGSRFIAANGPWLPLALVCRIAVDPAEAVANWRGRRVVHSTLM